LLEAKIATEQIDPYLPGPTPKAVYNNKFEFCKEELEEDENN
jgi:hypothetical protein